MSNPRAFVPHNAPFRQKQYLPMQAPRAVIGRDRVLASMHSTLKNGQAILIGGASGIGKTTLAALLATGQLAGNPDGVLWLDQTEEDARLLIAQIGRAFGIDAFTNDLEADRDRVRAVFRDRKPLIVLDGLVDLEAAADVITNLAPGVPTIVVDETAADGPWQAFALEPLNIVDSAILIRAYGGVKDASTTPEVNDLARRLDGHPMALELTGRQIAGGMTVAQLMDSLPPGTPQDSTAKLIQLTYQRLNPPPQDLWMDMACLPSGSGSIELISIASEKDPADVVAQARKLYGYGILNDAQHYTQPYLTLQRPAWRFARATAEAQGKSADQTDRGLLALLVYLENHAKPSSAADHDRLAAEMTNIIWGAAEAANRGDRDIVEELVRYVRDEAGDFVATRMFKPELAELEMLGQLESSQPQANPLDSEPAVPQVLPPVILPPVVQPPAVPPVPPAIVPQDTIPAETRVSPVAETRPSPPPDIPPTEPEPLVLPDLKVSDLKVSDLKLSDLGLSDLDLPPLPTEALADLSTEWPSTEPQLVNRRGEAMMLKAMADQAVERGDDTTAKTYYLEALNIFDELFDAPMQINVLDSLVQIGARAEDITAQTDYAGRGISVAEPAGDRIAVGRFQIYLGDVHAARKDNIVARDAYSAGIQALGSAQEWETLGGAMYKLAGVYLELDKPDEALQILEPALSIFRKENHRLEEARALIYSGSAYARKRQWERAEQDFQTASQTVRAMNSREDEQACYAAIGRMRTLRGDLASALENYRKALYLAYQNGDRKHQPEYLFHIADVLIDDVRTLHQAAHLLRDAVASTPTAELQRLLKRAETRLTRAGKPVTPTVSAMEYAASAYTD